MQADRSIVRKEQRRVPGIVAPHAGRIAAGKLFGTIMLTPAGLVAACDKGALLLLGCAAGDLLNRSVAVVVPELPLSEHAPSANVRYANQYGGLVAWRPFVGRGRDGRIVPLEILLSRCGFRASAALCLFLRRHRQAPRAVAACRPRLAPDLPADMERPAAPARGHVEVDPGQINTECAAGAQSSIPT
jgi:hypothetical protein